RSGGDFDVHMIEGQRVTEGDDLRGQFGGLDARQAGDGEDITFGDLAGADRREGLRVHLDAGGGDGAAKGRGLGGDVDHSRATARVEMGQSSWAFFFSSGGRRAAGGFYP